MDGDRAAAVLLRTQQSDGGMRLPGDGAAASAVHPSSQMPTYPACVPGASDQVHVVRP